MWIVLGVFVAHAFAKTPASFTRRCTPSISQQTGTRQFCEKDIEANTTSLVQRSKKLRMSRSISDSAWSAVGKPHYLLLKSEPKKLLFCMIPKNACSEFLSLVMRLHGLPVEHWNPTSMNKRHDSVHYDHARDVLFLDYSKDRDELENILTNASWTRAVFFRDPVERLISAFLTKVQTGFYERYEPNPNVKYSRGISFDELVTRLENDGLSVQTEPHLRPQSLTCALNELIQHYNIVGTFDNLDADAHRMVESVSGETEAKEMLDNGWGPRKNQSLFGVPRDMREAGAEMMPVTHASEWISRLNLTLVQEGYNSWFNRGAHSYVGLNKEIMSGTVSETSGAGIFWQHVGPELAAFLQIAKQIQDDSSLRNRIEQLYFSDYQMIKESKR